MPLMVKALPAGIDKVVDDSIRELVGHGALAIGLLAKPTVAHPLPLFHLGADAVADGRGTAAAKPTGWLASVSLNGQVIGGLELSPAARPRNNAPHVRFSSFNTGVFQRGIAQAVAAADKASGGKLVSLAVLRIPALHLVSLWLTDDRTEHLVPIPPTPSPLVPSKQVLPNVAFRKLRRAAQRVLEGDETLGG